MNTRTLNIGSLIAAAAATLVIAACSSTPHRPQAVDDARAKLTQLQSDPQLATRAPLAMKEAEAAVSAAEVPQKKADIAEHLAAVAQSKVDIAWERAHTSLLEDQRKTLSEQRETARLDARTREADAAHSEANFNRAAAENARATADAARLEADAANQKAEAATQQADASRTDAENAKQSAEEMRQQILLLNARETDRGLVVTLGDVMFATGKSELKGGVPTNLNKLAAFLNKYPERTVAIEGHTDSVGSDDSNMSLSQRRADAVKAYLVGQGVSADRLTASGKGEGSPVASNDSTTGRQQNRRVEVIIANAVASK